MGPGRGHIDAAPRAPLIRFDILGMIKYRKADGGPHHLRKNERSRVIS